MKPWKIFAIIGILIIAAAPFLLVARLEAKTCHAMDDSQFLNLQGPAVTTNVMGATGSRIKTLNHVAVDRLIQLLERTRTGWVESLHAQRNYEFYIRFELDGFTLQTLGIGKTFLSHDRCQRDLSEADLGELKIILGL